MNLNLCRVCGLELDFAPWGEDGDTPSYDFCPCCDTEFGFEDSSYEAVKSQRAQWLQGGANWNEPQEKPQDWDLADQLNAVIHERSALLEALKKAGKL
ncbi:hypothetical protein EON80_18670 [bacterium]|nr:MAG: hypothetical protein EON80_18670 [bacterium]